MRQIGLLLLIPLLAFLSACQALATPTPTAVPPTDTLAPSPTRILPTATATITLTPTSTATPTATPFAPFHAVITGGVVNLRAGPGLLFSILRVLTDGETVTISGKAPGGNWFRVQTPEKTEGWVYRWLLRADVDLQQAPLFDPQNVQRIRGLVRDAGGTPISGLGFTISQKKGAITSTDTAITDSDGEFFSFLPLGASGKWTVVQNAISCDSNAYADTSCTNYKNGYKGNVEPPSVEITLPYSGVLEFTWS
jgi:hypothetical protein